MSYTVQPKLICGYEITKDKITDELLDFCDAQNFVIVSELISSVAYFGVDITEEKLTYVNLQQELEDTQYIVNYVFPNEFNKPKFHIILNEF